MLRISLVRLLWLCLCLTTAIIGRCSTVKACQGVSLPPVLLSESNSTRAIALNSVTLEPEPFALETPFTGQRTRVLFFAMNLAGATLADLTVEAEDGAHRAYPLTVEFVGPVAVGQQWVTQLTVRLNDQMQETGDLLVRVTYCGLPSNRVRIGLGHIGDGPPDDIGAAPTPGPYLSDLSYVIDFDGSPETVDYGIFWQPNIDLGKFFWEFWAMPGDGSDARYLLSDGYGGNHALLFGFTSSNNPLRYALFGNIYNGQTITTFSSDDGPAPGEWGHFAVGWDGQFIVTYFNGVPVGRSAFAGPRRTPGPASGGGWLLIGGSDHNNFKGRIAQVRGYEGVDPLQDEVGNHRSTAAFAPETLFALSNSAPGSPRASFLSHFFRPASVVPDLAGGLVGRLRGVALGIVNPRQTYPLPKFIFDSAAPNASREAGPFVPSVAVDTPAPVPGGTRVFDSFSRKSATLAFDGSGGLGSTEGGTEGPLAWRLGFPRDRFGILNGRAVILTNFGEAIAWVPVGSSSGNLDVRVDRARGAWGSGVDTGICFRVIDGSNYFFAYTDPVEPTQSGPRVLTVGYVQGGSRTNLVVRESMANEWTTLRVVTKNNGDIAVYADNVLTYSTSSTVMAGASGIGIYSNSLGLGLTNRWDNFTVRDAP
jgi:Concanavalin A-like lectin/glucanases superfamily